MARCPEDCRAVVNGKIYDVMVIDNPMELNEPFGNLSEIHRWPGMSIKFEDNSMEVKEKLEELCIGWLYEAAGELTSQTQRNSKKSDKWAD